MQNSLTFFPLQSSANIQNIQEDFLCGLWGSQGKPAGCGKNITISPVVPVVCVCVCVFSWVCKHIGQKTSIESSDVMHKNGPKCQVNKSFSFIVFLHGPPHTPERLLLIGSESLRYQIGSGEQRVKKKQNETVDCFLLSWDKVQQKREGHLLYNSRISGTSMKSFTDVHRQFLYEMWETHTDTHKHTDTQTHTDTHTHTHTHTYIHRHTQKEGESLKQQINKLMTLMKTHFKKKSLLVKNLRTSRLLNFFKTVPFLIFSVLLWTVFCFHPRNPLMPLGLRFSGFPKLPSQTIIRFSLQLGEILRHPHAGHLLVFLFYLLKF